MSHKSFDTAISVCFNIFLKNLQILKVSKNVKEKSSFHVSRSYQYSTLKNVYLYICQYKAWFAVKFHLLGIIFFIVFCIWFADLILFPLFLFLLLLSVVRILFLFLSVTVVSNTIFVVVHQSYDTHALILTVFPVYLTYLVSFCHIIR